ncbi:MAG: Gfo/Idh/MocA family oxidoreductase [Alphaproteobacteria bacterium]
MRRLRTGVVGAGLIAQVEHIPNILRLSDRFQLVGAADPSATARKFVRDQFGAPVYESVEPLLEAGLDAIVVASPDFFHTDTVLQALAAGIHVFCEKPLCYSVAEANAILKARDRAERVVQVGYMKRFDPSYEAALDLLPKGGKGLRYISVEVNDPDSWPFVAHHPNVRGDDVPKSLIEKGRKQQVRQVVEAVGSKLKGAEFQGFTRAYCSSLVHDVNAVHGMLDRMGIPDGDVNGAQFFARGDGGSGTVRLLDGAAVWHMVHLTVPSLAEYRERISLYFDDSLVELVFPSPYLNHQPTELHIQRSKGHRLEKTLVRNGFEEAFIRELESFWSSIVEGARVRNTVEDARRDMGLLCDLARCAVRNRGKR